MTSETGREPKEASISAATFNGDEFSELINFDDLSLSGYTKPTKGHSLILIFHISSSRPCQDIVTGRKQFQRHVAPRLSPQGE